MLGHLPEAERPWVTRKLREGWAAERADLAERRLRELARALAERRPGAAASVREGLAETLATTRLGVTPGSARRTDARLDEPDRVDALNLPGAGPQRQALARRGDAASLDGRGDARRRAQLPPREGLPRPAEAAGGARRHAADVDRKEVKDFATAA